MGWVKESIRHITTRFYRSKLTNFWKGIATYFYVQWQRVLVNVMLSKICYIAQYLHIMMTSNKSLQIECLIPAGHIDATNDTLRIVDVGHMRVRSVQILIERVSILSDRRAYLIDCRSRSE